MIEPDMLALCASVVLAAAGVTVAVMARRGGNRGRGVGGQAGEHSDLLQQVERAKADVEDLIRQLELAGERLETKVDSRLKELGEILEQAKRKAAELQALVQELPPHMTKKPMRLGKSGADDVQALAERGMDPVEIARQVRMDVGEVELLLSLRRSQKSLTPPAEVRE